MKLFTCANCENVLYFENTLCEKCKLDLGYWPEQRRLVPLLRDGDVWQGVREGKAPDSSLPALRFCDNATYDACNWLVAADEEARLCLACRHNGVIPSLDDGQHLPLWRKVQRAKHRLFYSLLRLKIPLGAPGEVPAGALIFDVLADAPDGTGPKVMTGHDNGRITLALIEADDSERERRRAQMGEPYRSLLGHFRHEIGHYYWDVLVRDDPAELELCRELFGDDSQDYDEALQRYYANGPASHWWESHVSAYATAHPWEDFAESFAHYLHIMDTVEMADAFGVRLRPRLRTDDAAALTAQVDFDPYATADFGEILEAWLPLTFMANSLNRCMGSADLYPFTLSQPACAKMAFIHRVAGKERFTAASQEQQQAA